MGSKIYKTSPIKVLAPAETDKRIADALSISADEVREARLNRSDNRYQALVDQYLVRRNRTSIT